MFKKLIKTMLIPSVILSISYSCESETSANNQESTDVHNISAARTTSEINSDLLFKITGTTSIEKISENGENQQFRLIANEKVVNNFGFNLNEISVDIQDESSSKIIKFSTSQTGLQSEISYSFSTDDSKKVIDLTSDTVVDDAYLDNERNNVKYQIALLILTKIEETSRSENGVLFKINNSENLAKKSCERTITSIRYTKSSASNHVTSATNSFIAAHPDCHRVDGVDAGCLWADYGCAATQSIECTGGGCSVGYGAL